MPHMAHRHRRAQEGTAAAELVALPGQLDEAVPDASRMVPSGGLAGHGALHLLQRQAADKAMPASAETYAGAASRSSGSR
jgi:hypothetical protein